MHQNSKLTPKSYHIKTVLQNTKNNARQYSHPEITIDSIPVHEPIPLGKVLYILITVGIKYPLFF